MVGSAPINDIDVESFDGKVKHRLKTSKWSPDIMHESHIHWSGQSHRNARRLFKKIILLDFKVAHPLLVVSETIENQLSCNENNQTFLAPDKTAEIDLKNSVQDNDLPIKQNNEKNF